MSTASRSWPLLGLPSLHSYLYHCLALYVLKGYYHLFLLASLTVLPKAPPSPWGLWLENKAAVAQTAKRIHRKTGLNEFMLSKSGDEKRGGCQWGGIKLTWFQPNSPLPDSSTSILPLGWPPRAQHGCLKWGPVWLFFFLPPSLPRHTTQDDTSFPTNAAWRMMCVSFSGESLSLHADSPSAPYRSQKNQWLWDNR